MRKVLAILVLLIFVTGAAFAQLADGVRMGVWGHIGWTVLEMQLWKDADSDRSTNDKEEDLRSGLGAYWGNHHGRPARLQFSGSNDQVGFSLWLQTDNNTVTTGDFASIWARPFDFLRIEMGRFNENRLRGRIGETNTNSYVLQNQFIASSNDADILFNRFEARPGVLVSLFPMDGLFIGAFVNYPNNVHGNTGGVSGNALIAAPRFAKDVYNTFHGAVGYTIPDMGLIRIGYLHDRPSFIYRQVGVMETFNRLEAAFALTAVENLVLDIGLKFLSVMKKK